MRISISTSIVALLSLSTICDNAIPKDALSCRARETASLQILLGKLDAGRTTRESFSLSENGLLSRATWNDNNQILKLYESVNIGSESYVSAHSILSSIQPTPSRPTEIGVSPSPSVLTIEIAISDVQQPVDFILRDASTGDLNQLLNTWEQQIEITVPIEGIYVWTMPAPVGVMDSDVVITQPNCESGIALTIDEGVLSSDVVIHTTEDVGQFLRDDRSRYIARSANGNVYFAVLSSL